MAKPITHGAAGYRRGCKCAECRGAHAKAERDRRLARKTQAAREAKIADAIEGWEEPRPPLQSVPDAAEILKTEKADGIEAALNVDLGHLVGEPPWIATLKALALMNARYLDHMAELDRLDLSSPIQLRLLEQLTRLRASSASAGGLVGGVEAMLGDLSGTGDQ
jgi:hypothetical protein